MGQRTWSEDPLCPHTYATTPIIFECLDVKRPKAQPSGNTSSQSKSNTEVTEQKGDLLIRGLRQNEIDSVYGMHVLNTDTKSYLAKTPEKFIQEEERANKKIYLQVCLQKCPLFLTFFASADGLRYVEAAGTLKRISSHLSTKCQQPYFRMCGYVKCRISIALVWSSHQCIRGPG